MDGPNRSSSLRRGRARLARAALITAIATGGLAAAPGTASAAGSVTPLLDCYTVNQDGSWTAVFGYDNPTGAAVTIPRGAANKVTPVTYGTPQPTTFEPGVHHGAFSVTVTRGAGPMWHLDKKNLAARRTSAPACPASTELPEDGNGTGPAIALVLAGVIGAVALQRVRRRSQAVAGTHPGAERDDA